MKILNAALFRGASILNSKSLARDGKADIFPHGTTGA